MNVIYSYCVEFKIVPGKVIGRINFPNVSRDSHEELDTFEVVCDEDGIASLRNGRTTIRLGGKYSDEPIKIGNAIIDECSTDENDPFVSLLIRIVDIEKEKA